MDAIKEVVLTRVKGLCCIAGLKLNVTHLLRCFKSLVHGTLRRPRVPVITLMADLALVINWSGSPSQWGRCSGALLHARPLLHFNDAPQPRLEEVGTFFHPNTPHPRGHDPHCHFPSSWSETQPTRQFYFPFAEPNLFLAVLFCSLQTCIRAHNLKRLNKWNAVPRQRPSWSV